jgi:plastocyanin
MRIPVLVVACVALAVPAGCGSDDSSDNSGGGSADKAPAKTTKSTTGGAKAPGVVMKDIAFKPTSLSVKKGATVTWTNEDSVGHDVTGTGGPATFKSGAPGGLANGDTFKHTFTKPGTYDYVCTVHSNMKASVTVK